MCIDTLGAGILILSVLSAALAADLTVTVGGILRWNRQLDAMEKIAADLRELSGRWERISTKM